MSSAVHDLATDMLLWLAREPERLGAFLALTGFAADELRTALGDDTRAGPVQLAVLEYLLGDESLLLQFCAETDTPPELPARLWRTLDKSCP